MRALQLSRQEVPVAKIREVGGNMRSTGCWVTSEQRPGRICHGSGSKELLLCNKLTPRLVA